MIDDWVIGDDDGIGYMSTPSDSKLSSHRKKLCVTRGFESFAWRSLSFEKDSCVAGERGGGVLFLTSYSLLSDSRAPSSKKVCFRDLTIGIFGPAAPTTLARMVTPCFHTALVRAYSDFVIR